MDPISIPFQGHDLDRFYRYRCSVPVFRGSRDDGFFYAILLLSGGVRYQSSGLRFTAAAGDILLLGAWEQASMLPKGSAWEGIVLRLEKERWQELGDCFLPCAGKIAATGIQKQYLTSLFEGLLSESQSQDPYAEISGYSMLLLLLVALNRQTIHADPRPGRPLPESVAHYVLLYVDDHFTEDLTLDFLANRFFVSKYHLSREFQRIAGMPVHRYIVRKRLEKAQALMAQGTPSTEVYQHCGFGDYSNFYRAFKKEFGMTPKQWKAVTAR